LVSTSAGEVCGTSGYSISLRLSKCPSQSYSPTTSASVGFRISCTGWVDSPPEDGVGPLARLQLSRDPRIHAERAPSFPQMVVGSSLHKLRCEWRLFAAECTVLVMVLINGLSSFQHCQNSGTSR
jgi:hypothetical protein